MHFCLQRDLDAILKRWTLFRPAKKKDIGRLIAEAYEYTGHDKTIELLDKLKKEGVPKINLKAVVTETNAGWTVYQLYEQLREEHAQMQ